MSPLDALIAECEASPEDDGPRIVWADAVGGDRGELVMLQCGRGDLRRDQLAARNRRERELLANELAWSGLEGLARCVRFRRGFVDAIEVDADVWLRDGERIVAIAPLLTSITVIGLHPPDTTHNSRAQAQERLERIVTAPPFARIRGIDLIDHPPYQPGYSWGDSAIGVLVSTGVVRGLVALGLPQDLTPRGLALLTAGVDLAFERLWLRGQLDGAMFRNLPRLVELDSCVVAVPIAAVAESAHRIASLRMPWTGGADLVALADSSLALRLERLTLDATLGPQLEPEHIASLARLSRLRALDLRGDLALRADTLRALAHTPMPELRELRLGWTRARAELDELVTRLGPQLDLLDLRATIRSSYPHLSGDLLVDEPRERSLLHAHAAERARWYEPAAPAARGAPCAPEWLVAETGTRAGQTWSFGHIGDDWIRIGRMPMCDVALYDDSVGRMHAVLQTRDGLRVVKDLGSTNGVVVDGERLWHVPLVDGARFKLGVVQLRYFVGAGGGERATACARALATTDPVTRLQRHTRADAARIHVANLADIVGRRGALLADAVMDALATRLREAAPPGVVLTSPELEVIGVHPAETAHDLAIRGMAPLVIDNVPVQLELEVSHASSSALLGDEA